MPIHYFLMSWDLLNPLQYYSDYIIEVPEKGKNDCQRNIVFGTYPLPVGRSFSLRLPVFIPANSISIALML